MHDLQSEKYEEPPVNLVQQIYTDFENEFRGTRDTIIDRLRAYTPLLRALPLQLKETTIAVDVGCGRGEWLEVLHEEGWTAIGVDTNASALPNLGLQRIKVEIADALTFLKSQPAHSVGVLSAFQVVEHLPTEYLLSLLYEALRVLHADGLIILETPNSENVGVGSNTFYLDPTHLRPLPPLLLQYLVRRVGFSDPQIVRLNGPQTFGAGSLEAAVSTIFRASPDYAIIAQIEAKPRENEPSIVQAFAAAVSQVIPNDIRILEAACRTLEGAVSDVASKVDGSLAAAVAALAESNRLLAAEAEAARQRLRDVERNASLADVRAQQVSELRNKLDNVSAELREANALAVARGTEISALAPALAIERLRVSQMLSSTSWRISAPIRGVRLAVTAFARVGRSLATRVVGHARNFRSQLLQLPSASVSPIHVAPAPHLEAFLTPSKADPSDVIGPTRTLSAEGLRISPGPEILEYWRESLSPVSKDFSKD